MASTTATSVAGATSTPTSAQDPIPSTAAPDGFLRPASPKKRRRSPDGAESPAKNLDGQVRNKLGIASPPAPVELTGAAEMAEKRRKLEHIAEQLHHGSGKEQSTNRGQQALSALRSGSNANANAISRPGDVPQLAAPISGKGNSDANPTASAQISPVSNASFNTAVSAGVNAPQVASPTQMEPGEMHGDEDTHMTITSSNMQTASPKSYSYPEPSLNDAQANSHVRRDMSLPGGTVSDDTKSPAGNKKHKCPYCDTEFTRHHNLKSHLLTHSQEKPFMCQQCDMRFRRLHDLKRHTKLHTGERPHVCPICNRKFARGDALARHTKGAGGCAGHRSSVGSFTNEAANEGEMVMDNLMYTGEASQEPGEMDEGEGPSRQLRHAQYQNSASSSQARGAPSTYPPVANRTTGNYLQAPNAHSSATVSPSTSPAAYAQSGHQGSYPPPSSFGPSGGSMTESPAPISPSTNHHPGSSDRRRSSITQQLHHYARQGVQGHTSPQSSGAGPAPTATMGLPPPQALSSSGPPNNTAGHFAQLPPPLPSISTDGRTNAGPNHAHGSVAAGPAYQSGPGSASTHNSLSSHGQSSGERGGLGIDERERLWAIINSLRTELSELREKQDSMERELRTVKKSIQKGEQTA